MEPLIKPFSLWSLCRAAQEQSLLITARHRINQRESVPCQVDSCFLARKGPRKRKEKKRKDPCVPIETYGFHLQGHTRLVHCPLFAQGEITVCSRREPRSLYPANEYSFLSVRGWGDLGPPEAVDSEPVTSPWPQTTRRQETLGPEK